MKSSEIDKSSVINLATSIEYAEAAVVSKTILKKQSGNLTLFAFAKNEGLSEHTAPFDAAIQVLDGKGEITIGGTPYILDTGQFIIMPANITHAVKAVEDFKMLLIMIKSD